MRPRSNPHPVSAFSVAFLVLALASPALAAPGDWYVDVGNPRCPGAGTLKDPFCKIQDGIRAARTGDAVHVAPGRYVENIDFLGKDITVKSSGGLATTIIDGGGVGSVVTFQGGETSKAVLEGFRIENGVSAWASGGGGIFCNKSSPTILRSKVSGNKGSGGAGIFCDASSPTIQESEVSGNQATFVGGGLACGNKSSPKLIQCRVISNFAMGLYCNGGGIYCDGGSSLVILGSTICLNSTTGYGGGIYLYNASMTVHQSTLSWNNAGGWPNVGGGIYCLGSTVRISNSIVWGNARPEIFQLGTVTATYSDIGGGWSGVGNIDKDPLFVDAVHANMRLRSNSPCIDLGDPAAVPSGLDLEGTPRFLDGDLDRVMRVDMGSCEFDNVGLTISGTPTPNGQLQLDSVGTAGLSLVRLVGVASREVLVRPFGALLIDLGSPWAVFQITTLPSRTTIQVPTGMPKGMGLVFQDLALHLRSGAGNTSNPVQLTIR